MQKEKIFISGKISGLNYTYAWHKFASAEKYLSRMDYKVINPMCFCKKEWCWLHCMAICLWYLVQCDTIFLLENWEFSRGAKIEYKIAQLLNKNIIKQNEPFSTGSLRNGHKKKADNKR